MPLSSTGLPRRTGACVAGAVPARVVLSRLALGSLLLLASCAEDEPARCPTFQVGAVEGYVRAAGSAMVATVGARVLIGGGEGQVVATTVSAADGWYRLDLPTGRYRLEVEPERAFILSAEPHDTLTITPQVRRHDLLRGRAEFTVGLPAGFEGQSLTLELASRNQLGIRLPAAVGDGVARFVFPALLPAAYAPRLSPLCGYPTGDSLRVGTEVVAVRQEDFRTSAATITGRVTGSWQQAGVTRPTVSAVDAGRRRVSDASCADDGAFTLTLLEPRPVRLRVSIDGREQWLGGASFESARILAPGPGERLADADFVESGLDIRLRGPGDWLVQDATILLRDGDGNSLGSASAYGGRLVIGNLPPGRCYVQVDGACPDQVWAPQWYDGAADAAAATPIDLAAGELRRLDIALVTGGRIAGDVRTASGGIPAASYAQLAGADHRVVCQGAVSLTGGRFEFAGLPDGTYHLAAAVTYGAWWWYPGTDDIAQAGTITVTDHAAVTGLSWQLPGEPGRARP